MNESRDFQLDRYNRAREDVLEAIRTIYRAKLMNPHVREKGVTYLEIRNWIKIHKRYDMENVGARCRELARDFNPPLILIQYNDREHALVTPLVNMPRNIEET